MIKFPLLIFLLFTLHVFAQTNSSFNWSDTVFKRLAYRTIKLDINPNHGILEPFYSDNQFTLDTLSKFLIQNPNLAIQIKWHCDMGMADEIELKFAKTWVESLKEYLVQSSIYERRITAIGLGNSDPIFSDTYIKNLKKKSAIQAAHQANNRIEIILKSVHFQTQPWDLESNAAQQYELNREGYFYHSKYTISIDTTILNPIVTIKQYDRYLLYSLENHSRQTITIPFQSCPFYKFKIEVKQNDSIFTLWKHCDVLIFGNDTVQPGEVIQDCEILYETLIGSQISASIEVNTIRIYSDWITIDPFCEMK